MLEIEFVGLGAALSPVTVVLAGDDFALASVGQKLDRAAGGALTEAAQASDFKGKSKSLIELLVPPKIDAKRLMIVGVGKSEKLGAKDWVALGGFVAGSVQGRKTAEALLVAEVQDFGKYEADEAAADLALGAILRAYTFDKYKTKKKGNGAEEGDEAENGEPKSDTKLKRLVIATPDPKAARAAFVARQAVGQGAITARDLINEPANILGPVEFADRVEALDIDGLEVDVLDDAALQELNMNALLGVAQGSVRPARMVVMRWYGAKSKRTKPICFLGKGVTFDTGGISIKPSGGMEEMKGDMGGAAAVVGVMQALALRQAKVNAIGIIGLVENMPSAMAQRPGDIVTSRSKQTVEVLNTDAEGRLVLADCLTYAQDTFNPKVMINLATLTGAIMMALGREYAGLFANDDRVANDLMKSGQETGERLWRMPLDPAYDKLMNSPNADMKNIGGRLAGAITAAQFLQRFVKDTPWAHLDIAGVAFSSGKNETNRGWASGWGVQLLNHYVGQVHEK